MKKKPIALMVLLVILLAFYIVGSLISSPYINGYYALSKIILLELTSPINGGYIQCESNPPKFILRTKDEDEFRSGYFDEYSEYQIKGLARRGNTYYKYKFAPFSSRYSIALLEELQPDHPDITQ